MYKLSMFLQRSVASVLRNTELQISRHGSHYPVDDNIFGLTEDQKQVRNYRKHNELDSVILFVSIDLCTVRCHCFNH